MFNETSNALLCQHYLEHVYQRIQAENTDPNTATIHSITETYGEIFPSSVNKIIAHTSWRDDDVFYDLGSGIGKVAAQFFLLTTIKQIYGIEIRPELHHQASQANQIMQQELPEFYAGQRQLAFILGSFLEIPLKNATILFISATCFDPTLIKALSLLINTLPHVHTILTFRPLPYLKNIFFKKTFTIECSWDTTLCYVYKK